MTPSSLPALASWINSLRSKGPYPCQQHCGQKTPMPGVCAACGAADNARQAAEASALRCASAGISERFRWAKNLDCPALRSRVANPAAIDAMRRLDASVSALLAGIAGSGKSSLACAWGSERIAAGLPFLFVPARAFRSLEKDRLDYDVIHRAIRARTLVIDDVGQECAGAPPGGGIAAQRAEGVRHVIEQRHDLGLPTVITTGLTRAELIDLYGAGVTRRIAEDADRANQIIRCDAAQTADQRPTTAPRRST